MDDPMWIPILQRLRVGECSRADLDEMDGLVFTNPKCDVPNFQKAP